MHKKQSLTTMLAGILDGCKGVSLAIEDKLDNGTIKMLAKYVYSMSNLKMSGKLPIPICRILVVTWLLAGTTILCAQTPPPSIDGHLQARLQELEDREQIRQLMHHYGRFLDERNFDAFAGLFAETDSEYISGNQTARGAEAIGKMLKDIVTTNPSGFKSPNFHVFFNESIDLDGDQATAFSQSAYIVPGVNGNPEMVFFATYDDVFMRELGRWKFKRRVVHGNLPVR